MLEAASDLFETVGDEKYVPFSQLFTKVIKECDRMCIERLTMQDFMHCLEKLEDYTFLKIDKNKKDHKSSFVALAVDLLEL